MTFPTTPILDNFNRGDEGPPPSASWSTPSGYGGLAVSSNTAINTDVDSHARWNNSLGPDCEAYYTIANVVGTGVLATWSIELFLRLTSVDIWDGYGYRLSIAGDIGSTCTWYLKEIFTDVVIDTGPFTLSIGDSIGIQAIGTTISAYHKPSAGSWTLLGSGSNGGASGAGYTGAALSPNGVQTTQIAMDNFGGGTLAAFTADFSGTPLSGPAPLTVAFTDATSDTPTTWNWDFGNGDISGFQNPSSIYPTPGTYTVALTASNGTDTDTETKVDYITVLGAPVVDFVGVPTSGYVALSVDFTDLSTNSPDTWFWDFGDGTSSTSQNPTHVYNFIGTYTVTLTASSTAGSDFETKVDYITVLAISEYGAATIENCDVDTGGAAVGLQVSDVAIARDNRFGSVVIDSTSQLNAKDNAYSTLTNNGVLNSYAGDRSVWDTTNYPERHARDIDEATGTYHLVSAVTQAYTISNPSTDRAYDVSALTLNELAAVVGTLIADLQAKGLLS